MRDGQAIASTGFSFAGQKGVYRGKVRDVYDFGDHLMLVATDRYSAFDRNLAVIPRKGELVTAVSRWWFEQTGHIVNNHVIGYPDPNVTWCKKYKVLPIEMVVRGYITGVTSTSLWHTYAQGQRDYGEFTLPGGLHKNQKLPAPVLTPTTKFEAHDRPLTPAEAVKEGLISAELWERLKQAALKLFAFGQKTAEAKGLILVDTKYEFGLDKDGNLVLIDELHTSDSARYWRTDTYQQQIAKGEEPDNYDKEFLRLWFKARFDPYSDTAAPAVPDEIVKELTGRYQYVHECLTGTRAPRPSADALRRMESNIKQALERQHETTAAA